ncbi:MAG: isochorismatase family protein [Acidobacteriota bacterium]
MSESTKQAASGWLFWDVDTQVDFMREDGALYVPDAESLDPHLARLTSAVVARGIPLVQSADDHELDDAEISLEPDFSTTYPPHCMRRTRGAKRIPQTQIDDVAVIGHQAIPRSDLEMRIAAASGVLLLKKHVDVFTNPNTEVVLDILQPERVAVYGVALDVCNFHAVEGLLRRGYRVVVVSDATRPLDPERGEELLAEWPERGVELMTTEELLAEIAL